jgi:hypothetical protein
MPITIEYSLDGATWRTLATVDTGGSSSGSYRYDHVPTQRTYYRARFAGDSRYLSSTAAPYRRVWPLAALTRPTASSSSLRYAKTYTFKGSLRPAHVSRGAVRILAYRKVGGVYVYRRTFYGKASGGTTYSALIRLPNRGSWRLRAYHPTDPYRHQTYSDYRYVTVR